MKNTLLLAFLLITKIAFGQIPEPQKNTYVNDFAHVLTADQVTSLNQNIFNVEKQSGVQLAIVLVDSIPAKYDIEEYSILIGRKWHVGKRDDGIVYVAAISQHKQRFEIARALDNSFNNQKSQDILAAIKPYFKQKDYNGGLQELITQVGATVGTSTQSGDSAKAAANGIAAQAPQADDPNGTRDFWVGLIAVFLIVALIIYLVRRSNRNRRDRFPPGGFGNGGGYYGGQAGVGSFLGGALAGYAAGEIIDSLDGNNQPQQPDNSQQNNQPNNDNDQADNTPDNWGNWGSGDDSSSSDSDSGFSDSDFSSDGGGGSDW